MPEPRGPGGAWTLGSLAAAALIAAGTALGWWFLPFTGGAATGLAARLGRRRQRIALPTAVCVAAAGWAVPLAWPLLRGEPVGATARVVAALAGLPPYAASTVALTLFVAVLQALAGLWLVCALTSLPLRLPRRPLRRPLRRAG
jgi:hypothetical protein